MHCQDFSNILSNRSDHYELIESMLNAYAVNEIVLDDMDTPVGYRFLEVNTAFEEALGLKRQDIIGKDILDVLPQTKIDWIDLCADVALNQKDVSTEYYSASLNRHYNVRIQSQDRGVFLTIFHDITSLKKAHSEVEKQKSSYESLFNTIRVGLLRTSVDDGKILKINPACVEMFGFDDIQSCIHTSVIDLFKDPEDRKNHRAKLLRNGKLNHTILQMRKTNKKPLTIAVSSTLHYENNIPVWIDSTVQDISKQQRAEERLAINSIVFEHTLEAVVISDENYKILTVNKAFSDITGYSKKEVTGKDFHLLWCNEEEEIETQCEIILDALSDRGSWQGEVYKRHKNGQVFPTHLSVIEGEKSKEMKYYISIFYDITYRKQSEEKLYQLAHFDPLTQLSNRHAFMDRLKDNIEKAKRYENRVAVFFMDLDGFKVINDTHGHDAGDQVLIETATRLKNIIRKSDMVARMGGDEFTIIIEDYTDLRSLNILSKKMIDIVSQEIMRGNVALKVTASIGISIYPDDALDLESVLKHADNAMYRAKELGKNNVQFFTKELNIDSVNQMIFEMELRYALEKNEMQIVYKPRVSLVSNEIIGFEALLRWENETYGKVLPEVFLPIAMQSPLINKILSWLTTTSISQVKKWQDQFNKEFSLSFSLPEKQLASNECFQQVQKALVTNGFKAKLLHLQIQQNILMQDNLLDRLHAIQELGIEFIIEDFGSGISSIADLHKLKVYAFKVDEELTKDEKQGNNPTLQVLVQLAHTLKASVIASGIEDLDVLENLKKLNFQQVQGLAIHPAKDSVNTGFLLSKSFY